MNDNKINLIAYVAREIGIGDPDMYNPDATARTAIRAIESAGYKIVPVIPTEAMEMDGKYELISRKLEEEGGKWIVHKIYEAMLYSAPEVN